MTELSAQKKFMETGIIERSLRLIFEILVICSSAILGLGFVVRGPNFAKLGLPLNLPGAFGHIENFHPRLFLFEIFYIVLFCCVLLFFLSPYYRSEFFLSIRKRIGFLSIGLVVLFFFGMIRLLLGDKQNLLLAIRNSAFVWYLPFCFLVSIAPVRLQAWEYLFRFFIIVIFILFSRSAIQGFWNGDSWPDWYPMVGVAFPIVWAIHTKNRWFWVPLFFLALGLVCSLYAKVQRTSILILFLAIVLWVLFNLKNLRLYLKRGAIFLGIFLLALWVFPNLNRPDNWWFMKFKFQSQTITDENCQNILCRSTQKAEADENGIEIFRGTMWNDAWDLFLKRPFVGIGFEEQVVYRVYNSDGIFMPNDGNFGVGKQPPIAGPHNSYLNALARLGAIGILFLLVHLATLYVLVRAKLWGCASVILAQIVYASFNVGLEGPVRSFFLLLGIGIALVCIWPMSHQKQELSWKL